MGDVFVTMLAYRKFFPNCAWRAGFDDFLAALEKETVAFGKPVVYVHGDTHIFRVDKPLFGSTSRRSIENFTRVATFGYPDTHWVRAIVDPKDPQVFSFRQEIVQENLVNHESKNPYQKSERGERRAHGIASVCRIIVRQWLSHIDNDPAHRFTWKAT